MLTLCLWIEAEGSCSSRGVPGTGELLRLQSCSISIVPFSKALGLGHSGWKVPAICQVTEWLSFCSINQCSLQNRRGPRCLTLHAFWVLSSSLKKEISLYDQVEWVKMWADGTAVPMADTDPSLSWENCACSECARSGNAKNLMISGFDCSST